MPKIFIAPADFSSDQADLDRSIVNAVERGLVINNFSDATYPELIDIERRGRGFFAWGLKMDPDNMEHWFQMGVGDFILISQNGVYRHYGKVLGRYENSGAALAIWTEPENPDDVRELLFFVTEPMLLSVPQEDLKDYIEPLGDQFRQVPDDAIERIEDEFESVQRFFRRQLLNTNVGGPIVDMSGLMRISEQDQEKLRAFDPDSSKDCRARAVEAIIRRRGRPEFREKLFEAYDGKCAITNCNAGDALEATYIIPYRGEYTHEATNGILLRADLHTLFDLGKIAIDTRMMTVVMTDDMLASSYRILFNRPLHFPDDESQRPSTEGLDLHRRLSGL
jgi:hypothetical protein